MDSLLFCTIFTPTYNRRDKLEVLYHSLQKSNNFNFEWLVVDDGSTDLTQSFMEEICNRENKFKIRYIKKENGGKHTAINVGVNNAKGKVFAIVDSDDYILPNTLDKLIDWFRSIEGKQKFAGVAGKRGYSEQKEIGTTFNGKFIDAKSNERNKYNIGGDKFEVFYTEILKEFPFPVFEGEKFMSEAIVWNRIANDGYNIRWFNEIVYICEYLENGLTDQKDKLVEKSPMGYCLYIKEQLLFGNLTFKQKNGAISYYYTIRKKTTQLKEISRELNVSKIRVLFSAFLRKLFYLFKG